MAREKVRTWPHWYGIYRSKCKFRCITLWFVGHSDYGLVNDDKVAGLVAVVTLSSTILCPAE